MYIKISFYPHQSTGSAEIFFFFFFQNIVRSSPERNTIENNKTKLHHMCYRDVQTMQAKFARFCQKKLWLLNWTPQRFGEIDAPDPLSGPIHIHLIFSIYVRLWHAWVASVCSARGLNQAFFV